MDAKILRPGRTAILMTAALLAALAAWAAMPSTRERVQRGRLLPLRHADRGGGEYFFTGNDSNLHNDLSLPE